MACDISLGRLEACKDSVGGLKSVYFINYDGTLKDDVTNTLAIGDIIDATVAGTTTYPAYKYELRGANSFDEANESSRENGTSFWTGTGTIALKKQDAPTRKELKVLSYGRPHVIFEDYNGNFFLAGAEHGCEVSVNTASGSAMGDFSGYNLTITSIEREPAYFVADTFIGGAVTQGFIVTEGV
jgi:hypothetical protein